MKGPLTDSSLALTPGHRNTYSPQVSVLGKSPPSMMKNSQQDTGGKPSSGSGLLLNFLGCMCGWLVKGDSCRTDDAEQQSSPDEDVLYCTLCNAEVRKYSKHCRSCDKCVDGFDHHCRWLNNCVGKKNYVTFVALMATCLIMLVLDWGVGIAVLVRCFTDKKDIEKQIAAKLGTGFSRAPFASIVAVCTLVPLLASIPLGELFFFHIILIRKGITTYEYVVAMRAQSEPQILPEAEQQSALSSPTSSTATGLSGSGALSLQYRGAWCTPPRVFVEHQEDEIIPHLGLGRVPSTVDPDSTTGRGDSRPNKRGVRISAWKLAKLDPNEAMRAASKARESSSILRPIGAREAGTSEIGYSSSSNASIRSGIAPEYGGIVSNRRLQEMGSPRTAYVLNRTTVKEGLSGSSLSSPGRTTGNSSATASPLPSELKFGVSTMLPRPRAIIDTTTSQGEVLSNCGMPIYSGTPITSTFIEKPSGTGTSCDVGDTSSGGDSMDDRQRSNEMIDLEARQRQASSNLSRDGRSAVYWDNVAGRFISVPTRNHLMRISNPIGRNIPQATVGRVPRGSSSAPFNRGNRSPDNLSTHDHTASESASVVSMENLTYSGTSIFFGGPLSMAVPGSVKKENIGSSDAIPTGGPERNAQIGEQTSNVRLQSPVFVPRSLQQEKFQSP
ncbi:hypothetical protein KP509_03G025100 [Ceratopteris richardii]|nr:hypothetical protein KP509_03G025100 [Ceratopteris richardii]